MKLRLESLQISKHAYVRILERFDLQHTKVKEVNRYIRKQLEKADYIGKITSSDGSESEMFINNAMCFYLTTDFTTVKTVIKVDKVPLNPVTNKMKNLIHKEFRKLDRTEKARLRQLELFKREAEVEIATLNLRIYKTKSEPVKFASQGRIAALELRLQELKNQIEQIKTDKRQVAKALVTII